MLGPACCEQTDYLHVFRRIVLCWVGAATLASLLGIAVDLTFIAGLRRQRIIIHLASLSSTRATASKAQTCDTVPGEKTKPSVIWKHLQAAFPQPFTHVPLPCAEVSRWTSTEVAPVCVWTAKLAGVLADGALIDVRASSTHLLVVEASGAEAAEAPQGVVAWRSPADLTVQALVLIWVTGSWREVNKVIPVKGPKQYWGSLPWML